MHEHAFPCDVALRTQMEIVLPQLCMHSLVGLMLAACYHKCLSRSGISRQFWGHRVCLLPAHTQPRYQYLYVLLYPSHVCLIYTRDNITISTVVRCKGQLSRKASKDRKRNGGSETVFKYNILIQITNTKDQLDSIKRSFNKCTTRCEVFYFSFLNVES